MTKKKDTTPLEIIEFWFNQIKPEQWWKKSAAFDAKIKKRFLPIYQKASAGELFNWRYKPLSSLAEIIILDQFPRNIFRDKSKPLPPTRSPFAPRKMLLKKALINS